MTGVAVDPRDPTPIYAQLGRNGGPQIINWLHMRGGADTHEGALLELQRQLDGHLREQGSLPRPGTGRKLEVKFAAAAAPDGTGARSRRALGVIVTRACRR